MDASVAIRLLIDDHGGAVHHLSRRQLADLARVNAGQLSNWLRGAGPLSIEKQGQVAQAILETIQSSQAGMRPTPIVENCIQSLMVFAPRVYREMMDPDAAWKGQPITHGLLMYIPRYTDEVVAGKLKSGPDSFAIVGGPLTGKSSLLLKFWMACRASFSTISIDFRQFIGRPAADLCSWIQQQCEAQIQGEVIGPVVLRDPDRFVPWIQNNVLPGSLHGQCMMFFDHPEALPRQALEAFDTMHCRYRWSEVTRSCGLVLAVDPAHQNIRRLSDRFAEGFQQIPMVALSENQVQALARRAYGIEVDGRMILKQTGGCVFLTQALLAQTSGKAPAETQAQALNTMIERIREDWSTEFRREIVDALNIGDGAMFQTNHLWKFDALCSGGLFEWTNPPFGVRIAMRPICDHVHQQLLTQLK